MAAVFVEPLWSILTLAEIDPLCFRSCRSQNWNWQILVFFFCCPSQAVFPPQPLHTQNQTFSLLYASCTHEKHVSVPRMTYHFEKKKRKLHANNTELNWRCILFKEDVVLIKSQHSQYTLLGWELMFLVQVPVVDQKLESGLVVQHFQSRSAHEQGTEPPKGSECLSRAAYSVTSALTIACACLYLERFFSFLCCWNKNPVL